MKKTSLHRNKACLNCRMRKTKCDAIKPVCTSCQRLSLDSICRYDPPPKWLERISSSIRREDEIKKQREVEIEQEKIKKLKFKLNKLEKNLIEIQKKNSNIHFFFSSSPSSSSSINTGTTDSIYSHLPQSISETNWLSHLPPRQITKSLIKTFFTRPLSPFTIVEPSTIQSHLDLSCWDPKFPHPALIHAICAIASQYLINLEPCSNYPFSDPPHLHHAQWAERLLNDGIISHSNQPSFDPTKLLQLSEAAVLCCQYYTLVGKPLMIWKSLGYSTRLATLLGLHTPQSYDSNHTPHIPSTQLEIDSVSLWPDGLTLLQASPDHRIQHYRTVLWWYVFCCDKMCAAAAGFASTIDEQDSLIPIYSPTSTSSASSSFSVPQTSRPSVPSDQSFIDHVQFYLPKSPGFFFCHQVGDFDSLQLLIKAAILVGRVNTCLYRRSNPTKSINQINQECQDLSNLICRFFNSIPECLKNPFRFNQFGHLDSCLLSAHTLIHTALIQINEDLVNQVQGPEEDGKDEHLKICQHSGKVLIEWFLELIRWKNLGLIQADLGDLLCGNAALNFGLSVSLRTHCRFIAIYKYKTLLSQCENRSQRSYLDKLEFQISLILSHLKQSQKMPLEGRIVELITFLLDSPWTLLPKTIIKSSSSRMSAMTTNNRKHKNGLEISSHANNLHWPIHNQHDYANSNQINRTTYEISLPEQNALKLGRKDEYLLNRSQTDPSTDTPDFQSMMSNFALAKLLDSSS